MPVNVIGTLKPKNNGKFPVAEAVDIKVTEDLRLDEALENKADLSTVNFALDNKADKTTANSLQGQIDQIAQSAGTGTADTEVAQARVGADSTVYQTLKGRLDDEQNALKTDIQLMGDSLVVGKKIINNASISASGVVEHSTVSKLTCFRVMPNAVINSINGSYDLYGFFTSEPIADSVTYNSSRSEDTISNLTIPNDCNWIAVRSTIQNDVEIEPKSFIINKIQNDISVLNESFANKTLKHYEVNYDDNGVVNASGVIESSDLGRNTGFISVRGFTKAYVKTKIATNYYAIAFFDSEKQLIVDESVIATTPYEKEYEIDIPENAEYIICSCYNYNAVCVLYNYGLISEQIEEMEVIVDDIKLDTTFIKQDATINGMVSINGTISLVTNTQHTDYIEIGSYDSVEYQANINDTAYELAYFDSDKNIMHDISIVGTVNRGVQVKAIPNGAKYLIISNYGTAFTAYAKLYKSGSLINKVEDNTAEIQKLKEINRYNFSNLKIGFTGDSICYGAGYTGGYAKLLQEYYGLQYQNIGVNGGHIAHDRDDVFVISNSISQFDNDLDAIIMEGGINDRSSSVPIGEITTDYTTAIDQTTFIGALEKLMRDAISTFPTIPKAFLIVHNVGTTNVPNSQGISFKDYKQAIINVCEKYGVYVIDINGKSCFNTYNTVLKEQYTANGDGLHPNKSGYELFYLPFVSEFVNNVVNQIPRLTN